MRTLIFALFISILFFQSLQLNAQRDRNRHEQIQAMKIAYITERLDLSSEEAEKFWPIYNDYNDKKGEILHEIREFRRYYVENLDNIDDEEHLELQFKNYLLQKLRDHKGQGNGKGQGQRDKPE